jgi:hypothetical protein
MWNVKMQRQVAGLFAIFGAGAAYPQRMPSGMARSRLKPSSNRFVEAKD